MIVSSTTFRSEAKYTCTDGYSGLSDSATRTCKSDGQWSGDVPSCTVIGRQKLYLLTLHYYSNLINEITSF